MSQIIAITHRYLNLPVKTGADKLHFRLSLDGPTVRYFDVELAVDGEPDFTVFYDMQEFIGKSLTLEGDAAFLSAAMQADEPLGLEDVYQEANRPQFHFSSQRGWLNDPNGLVYHDGEYHLFYQHNPFGINHGNMHWGHAVSSDMMHWQELPTALYPTEHGHCWSGSAVMDTNNTSGLAEGDEPTMIALYTAAGPDGQVQCLAHSHDRGRTWTDYANNPVIGNREHVYGRSGVRDPKVFWYEPRGEWVMVLFEAIGLSFFTSPNLIDWTFRSHLQAFWECPELYQLPVQGSDEHKWVLTCASGNYQVGEFDGHTFTPESRVQRFTHGKVFAAQTFNMEGNLPTGRRVMIPWLQIKHADMPFNQMMGFPLEVGLRATPDGPRQFAKPIAEIKNLYTRSHILENTQLKRDDSTPEKEQVWFENVESDLLHVIVEWELQNAPRVALTVAGYTIKYEVNRNLLNDRFVAPDGNQLRVELLIDRTSVEVLAGDGEVFWADEHQSQKAMPVKTFTSDTTLMRRLEVHELRSTWK